MSNAETSSELMEAKLLQARTAMDMCSAMGLFQLYIGQKTGIWKAMLEAGGGPMSVKEVSEKSGVVERYAKELLSSCATQKFVEYIPPNDSSRESGELGKFRMPKGYLRALCDPEFEGVNPFPQLLSGCTNIIPTLIHAFKNGGGVPFSSYGKETIDAISFDTKHLYNKKLYEWISSIPDIHERLTDNSGGTKPTIVDFGCGEGNSSIIVAKAYPLARVVAIEPDEHSFCVALKNFRESGVVDQIVGLQMMAHDALEKNADLGGNCDLILFLECFHDMQNPVEVLKTAKAMAKPETGTVLIMDSNVAGTLEEMLPTVKDEFPETNPINLGHMLQDPANFSGRIHYGFSVLHCLPVAMVHDGATGTGTCMSNKTLEKYAEEAGWKKVTVILEFERFRLYRLLQKHQA